MLYVVLEMTIRFSYSSGKTNFVGLAVKWRNEKAERICFMLFFKAIKVFFFFGEKLAFVWLHRELRKGKDTGRKF